MYKASLRANRVIIAPIDAKGNLLACGVRLSDLVEKAKIYENICKTVSKMATHEYNPRMQDPDCTHNKKQNDNWETELDVCSQMENWD
jgi:hypothetical protein